jgi:predicted permease
MKPKSVRRLFRFISRSPQDVRADVDDEIAFHVDMRSADLEASGLSKTEARALALREFGDVHGAARELAKLDERADRLTGVARLLAETRQDIRYGLRLLMRDRAFSVAGVLTLALAIGGNVGLFGLVNALFLQPLPVRAPDAIARIYTGESTTSWLNADEIRRRSTGFDDVIVQGLGAVSLAGDPFPLRLRASLVSMNYFAVLGAAPIAGRLPSPADRDAAIVVLGERLWRARFAGSPAIVGQRVTINGRAYQVAGVMPRRFRGIAPAPFTPDLWMPVDVDGVHRGLAGDRSAVRFEVYGRLSPGVTAAAAEAAVRVLGTQMAREHPETNERFGRTEVFGVSGVGLYRGAGKTLLPIFAFLGFSTVISVFVLIISCANLAGLFLGRAAARRREMAVRMAIGAGRGRLVRQLLIESLLLTLLGGAAGLALAILMTGLLTRLAAGLPVALDLQVPIDWRVVAFTVAASAACALLIGLAPARRASNDALIGALTPAGAGGSVRQRFRSVLVVAQVAVSALLLFWGALFARSVGRVGEIDPGFDASGVLLAEAPLADDRPRALQRVDAAFVALAERVRSYPGVDAAGWATVVPLALTSNERFRVAAIDGPNAGAPLWIVANRLSPGWFGTVRIPIAAGRDFSWDDREGTPLVAIVNETLARALWHGAAIGRRLDQSGKTFEVVGVVRDSKYWTIGEPIAPAVYLAFRQGLVPWPVTLHVRTSQPRDTAERLRRDVADHVPGMVPALQTMTDAVAVASMPARVGAAVTAAFGGLGALLATVGVYGLISYVVVQRTREIAIRRAIGASARDIARQVVGTSAALVLAGLSLGITAGMLTAPLLGSLLVNVSPHDFLALLGTALLVLATGVLASAPPALRATRVDPLISLKAE